MAALLAGALFTGAVQAQSAAITTSPSALTERNLNGATVTVTLTSATFQSGVTAASFSLTTAISGLSIHSIGTVSSGDTTATLTLAFDGDFSATATLAVGVVAAAHTGSSALTSGTVTVTPRRAVVFTPASLSVTEGASTTYTAALDSAPAANVTVTITSNNTDLTVDTSSTSGNQNTLTFSTTNWSTGQTVTAAAASDSDSADETATLAHAASGGGYSVTSNLFAGLQDPQQTGTDYDTDEDGLIEVDSFDKLNAMRWDNDGNGAVSAGDTANYQGAFPNAAAGMGCPDGSDANTTPDPCRGYELTRDLDFDTNDNGTIGPGDDYWRNGSGWSLFEFGSLFRGNGHIIYNLYVRGGGDDGALFGEIDGARIFELGLVNIDVEVSGNDLWVGGLAGHARNSIINGVFVTGVVRNNSTGTSGRTGGMVGRAHTPTTIVNSYTVVRVSGRSAGGLSGWGRRLTTRSFISRGTLASGSRPLFGASDHTQSIVATYFDSNTHGTSSDGACSGCARTTTQLQSPSGYNGIYSTFDDHDVNGDGERDEAWEFGTSAQWPVLKVGGFDTSIQFMLQPPVFSGAVTQKTGATGSAITPFQVPAATHAGTLAYTATGLPAGLVFDADGSGTCGTARQICGTPTVAGTFTVTVRAENTAGGKNIAGGNVSTSFNIVVAGVEIDADASTPSTTDPGPLTVSEFALSPDNAKNYGVRLATAPNASVTVTATSGDTGAVTVDTNTASGLQSTLTFTTTNWGTWQTVTATAVQDTDTDDESVTVTHAASGGGYNNRSSTLTVEVVDDELTEVLVDADPATTAVDRGPLVLDEDSARSDNYAVRLSRAPSAAVTVALASNNTSVTVSTASLTFTTTNWNTAQTVTASTTQDGDAVDEAADLTHMADGGGYDGAVATLRVGVSDAERTGTDYDADEDGLIDINSLAKLNAMRWDLDGDGSSTNNNYAAAFPNASTGMGCPDGPDTGKGPDPCRGYELTRDLDFDTNGNGFTWVFQGANVAADTGDNYYNGGAGWDPIGPSSTPNDNTHFNTTFEGNGYSIKNLFINRNRAYTALFAALRPNAVVRGLGLPGALVYGGWSSAPLAGHNWGLVAAAWATGTLAAPGNIGGLVGVQRSGGTVLASYSTARVFCTSTSAAAWAGGLVGENQSGGTITASYAAGPVSGACPANRQHGLTGGSGTVMASYWDTDLTGINDDNNATPPEGRSTTQLQTPTEYGTTGLYAAWSYLDVDGDGRAGQADDDAWDFGTNRQHPVLKFHGADTTTQLTHQAPSFGSGTVSQQTGRTGIGITSFQVPAATHSGAITYTATGLPPGLVFDGDGMGTCGMARAVCGTPTRAGTFTVTVRATNANGLGTGTISFNIVVGGIEIDADPSTDSTVEAGPLALTEGASDTYSVRLTSAPSANVTVTVTSSDTGAVTVDTAAAAGLQSTLTFTTTDWSSGQTVTAAAVHDADGTVESVTITHAAGNSGGYNNVSAPLTATVAEDELPELVVDTDPSTAVVDTGSLLLDEATRRARNYAVYLLYSPTASVTVALASDNPAVTLSASSLTFTTTSWSTAQTVTATTTTDADAVDEAADVTHTASGGGYDGVTATLRVGVSDAERTGTDYDTDEDGLLEISNLAQLNAVRWDLDATGIPTNTGRANWELAFPGAWFRGGCPDGPDANELADPCKGYELTRDLDFDTDGDGGTYTESSGTVTSDADDAYHNSGSGWDPLGPNSTPTNSTHFNAVFEGNGHSIYNLFINRGSRSYNGLFAALRPDAVVRNLGLPGASVDGGWSSAPLAGQSWGRVAAVWASGLRTRAPGNVGGLVGVQNSGGEIVASYSTVAVACTNSGASAWAGGLVGESLAGSAVASSYATGAVTGACPANRKYGLTGGSGTVTASYWDTTLTGINDDPNSTPPEGRTTAQLQAPTGYADLYATWDEDDVDDDGVAGRQADDVWNFGTASQHPVLKAAGLDTALQFNSQGTDSAPSFGTQSVTNKTYPEGSAIAQFQAPAASGGNGALSYSASGLPAGLVFDADGLGTCGVPRAVCGTPSTAAAAVTVTVTVTDGDDNTHAGDRDTLTFTITVTAPPAVSSRSLSLNEAAGSNTGTFTVALASAPAATTTLTVASADTGAVTVSPSALTFTTTDWSTAQTVTATAQQDDDTENESTTVTLWDGAVALARVSVTVADDDLGRVLVDADPSTDALDPGPIALGEPGDANYTVRLSAQPTANVVVSVSSADTGAVYLPSGHRSLTFTTGNWSTAQTKRVNGLADADALDEAVTVTFRAAGGGYNGTATRLRVTVTDDDRSGTDFDTDEDGLIEISTLAQLNAVRWDLDGDGSVSATDQTNYTAAFPSASAGMGCPSVSGTATCTGYELVADLDFDTDGDGVTHTNGAGDSGDATYYNSGAGFAPIGNRSAGLEAVFDGNGHVIYNLFVNRTTAGGSGRDTGLFGAVGSAGVVRSLGVADAWVSSASDAVGALVGRHYGRVEASWSSGSVTGNSGVGGLAGSTDSGSAIVAGYSTASVTVTGASGGGGGLAGWTGGDIMASYAVGAVTGGAAQHGLAGGSGGVTSSYWDTEASGTPTSTKGAGRTTAQLQSPTAATGIYAGWDRLDVNGDGDPFEAPWDFGTSSEYPVLRVGANAEAGVFLQRGDYDLDDDGLIDVYTLAQLNAVRWDLDGDGAASTGNAGTYRTAFRHHRDDMGCPTSTIDADDNDCAGFELMNDLDFDTDGDDSTHTAGVSDSGDAYHNSGSGWDPIGPAATSSNPPTDATHFNAVFDGGGHVVHNLFINRSRTYVGLFAALRPSAAVRAVGLRNVWVDGGWSTGPLAGQSWGRTAAVWASGTAEAPGNLGGLVGWLNTGGEIVASYSTASVECTDTSAAAVVGGLVGDAKTGSTVAASYSTGAVTGNCPDASKGGLLLGGGTVVASYWDVDISGVMDDMDSTPPEGEGTVDLQTPTEYGSSGLYATWDDQDVDGDTVSGEAEEDDAWEFGLSNQHPVLKWGGLDTAVQFNEQPDLAPSFTASAPSDVTVQNGRAITPIQIPAAGAGNGAVTVTVSGLPAGLSFDADGSGACGAERTICGTPGTDGDSTVTVTATDSDDNTQPSDQATLTFTITVATPSAAISATSPAALTENNLNGATVTVALTNTTFGSGVAKSSFTLDTNVPGLDVDSVATVASGDASATLTLDYDGTDFDTARTLGVTVAASAHALAGSLSTATVGVAAGTGVRVAPPSLSLSEDPTAGGGTGANQGSYSVVLESQPAGSVTVTATSADAAVTLDADGTPLTFSLTFTTTSWETAQSVTATAAQDDDAADESVQVTHAVTGYPGVTTATAVAVAVDDDETAAVLIDADPSTMGVDESGPVALSELSSAPNNTDAYTVRLSSPPTATVTVTATSADAGAVTVDTSTASGLQSALTFTSTNWATGQEVTLAAQQDADGVHESVVVTNAAGTASTSEYSNVSAAVTATVEDDEAPGFVFDSDTSTPAVDDAAPLNLDELAAGTNSDNYSVRLTSQPTQDVTVAITSPDTDAVTVGTSTLTFTTSNWRTAQTVAATAAQDLDGANESVDVSHAASTATNSEYTGITGDFEVAVDDDETPAITLSPTSLNVNEQNSAAYTVALATQPTGAVTVSITGAGSGISANPTSLAFTSTNWATARTVSVSAVDDQNSANEQVTLRHTAAGAAEYGALTADLQATALDNDTPSLRVDPTALTVPEGMNRTYAVRLNTQPSATVTVTVSGAGSGVTVDTDGAAGDQNTLTFTAMTWETEQTVTVSAAADDNGVDEMVSLSHAAAGGDYGSLTGAALPGVSVTADDDDTPAVLLDADPTTDSVDEAGPLALDEAAAGTNSDTYTVRLATEPTEAVTVTVTSSDAGAVAVGDTDGDPNNGAQNTLTFTAMNWDTRRTVTVAAAQDDDGVDEEAVVTNAASTAGMSEYGGLSAAVTVTVDDDETPGFAFDAVPSTPAVDDAGPLSLDELPSSGTNSASYTVRLATEPKQTVTVTVTSSDTGAVTVGDTDGLNPGVQNTLTFTSANWSAPQAVALTAQQDLDGADESVDIGHAAATTPNSEYTGVSADFRAAVDDDETPGITLSPASLTVGEQDSQTYTVVLDTEPAGGNGRATVTVTGAADGITASPTRLVFGASNWSTARTVTVRAADDQNSVNEVVTLSHAGSGADYDGVSKDLEVTAQDNDTPSLRVRPTALTVREDGSATYRIRLNTEPSAAVTVTVGGTTAKVTVDADRDATGDQTSLTFTDANWRAERTVAVSAAPDDDATDEMVGLTHAATGGDYTGLLLTARPGVSVTVDDDDEPAVLIDADPVTTNEDEPGPLALNELSGHPDNSKGYTVRLATEPTAQVEVVVTSGDRAVSVDTDQTPLTRTLTFTTTNWAMPQTVTATAAEDPDASNERVEIAHAADGGDYGGVSARLFATTVDDDEPALVVDAAALVSAGVAEGGSATYTVRLETEPAGVAVVSIAVTGGVSVDADGDQAGLQRSLRFDAANWSVARTVLVRGLEDDDAAAGMAALRHTSSGADYGRAQAVDVAFAVNDDDTPAVVIDQTAVAVNEGASAAYLVMLATAPSGGAVTVALSSSDAAAATVSPAVLRFTAGDWERPRRVTVRGEPDVDSADGSATVSHSVSGGDYGAVTASPVAVAVRDSEAAGVRVEPPRLTVREGGTGRYRVRLNTEPTGDVTVTATGGAELSVDSDETPQERALTFTTANWGAERTVTVEAARDDGAEDGSLTVTHAVSGYAGVATAPALQVRVEDGDEPGFTFDPEGGLSLSEEPADPADAMGAYTVRLATQPSGAVAVEVSSDDAGVEVDTDGTPRTLSLSFDASNWATGQSVSVRAVADADQVSEAASLLHTASGGGYGGVSGTLRVRVSDDDRPPAPPPPPPAPPENRPPVVVGSLADLDLDVGESASVRLGGVFADDGPLSHWAESSDGSVASARVEGNSMLRVSGLSPGAALVTVWAADAEGQRAQLSFRVSVGRVLSFDPASASAPEGGTLRLRLSLSRPAGEALSVPWTALPDGDAATADADAADVSALSGTAEFAAGRTEAFIDLAVREDSEIEPAREVLRVELSPPPDGANWALGRSWALLWVEEGVCDRSPAVRDALRGSRECSAPTSSDLSGRGYLGLHRLDLPALRPKDFLGLSGLRVLHLHGNLLPELPAGLFEGLSSLQRLRLDGNRLPSLPEGTFAGLGRLSSLRLDGNRLSELPPGLLSGAPNLERLDLGGNLMESLPPGLFAGAANLGELNLDGNPGAPFALVMRLTRTDAEPWEPGPAWVSAQVAEGAPFAFSAALAAENAAPSAESASVPAGATSGIPLSVASSGPGAARLSLSAGPALPATLCGDVQDGRRPCFRGLSVQAGPSLLLFKPPPSPTDEPPTPALSADGDRASLALGDLFSPAEAGDRLAYEAESDRPDLLSARISDGRLLLEANENGDEGTAVVTVTATDPDGPSATLSLTVQVEFVPVGAAPSWRLEWIRTLRDADQ